MSGPSGVPRQPTFDPTVNAPVARRLQPGPRRAAHRPAPRRRALLPALGTLAAPALAVLALTAFGALRDEPEAGLGSLPAAEGLQGSATGGPQPHREQGAGAVNDRGSEKDDFELADAEPDREADRVRREPVSSDCPDGPRAQMSKRRLASSSEARSAAGCAGDDPERDVEGDLTPGPGASTNPPLEDETSQDTTTEDDGSEDPNSGYDSP